MGKKKRKYVKRKLTEKQKLFCKEYLQDPNATRAYLKVYNVKQRVAEANGNRLMSNAIVKDYLQKNFEKKKNKLDLKAEDILKELKKLGLQTKIIKNSDKLKALELLGKYFKLFTDNVHHTGEVKTALVKYE